MQLLVLLSALAKGRKAADDGTLELPAEAQI